MTGDYRWYVITNSAEGVTSLDLGMSVARAEWLAAVFAELNARATDYAPVIEIREREGER